MCGRFALATPAAEWAALFRLEDPLEIEPRFNIAPTQPVAVVRAPPGLRDHPGVHPAEAGDPLPREATMLRWGLVPNWSREFGSGPPLINARSETVAQKPSFRDSFRERRCLVVADGFYEWRTAGTNKQPYWIGLPDGRPFAFAGLWDAWSPPDGPPVESCAILTTEASGSLRPLHDRMPLIVAPEHYDLWMDADTIPWELEPVFEAPTAADLRFHPVSSRVNSVSNDDPACLAPLEAQTELF